MRIVRILALLFLVAGSLAHATGVRADVSRCPATGTQVPPGASIQAFLDAGLPGEALCLGSGTYQPAGTLRPKSGQALYGVLGATVIDGRGVVASLFDGCSLNGVIGSCGPADPSGVGLYDLTLRGAKVYDVRTGSGWTLDGVSAVDSGQYGIVLRGTGTVVVHSSALRDARFGITASYTIGGVVQDDVIAFDNGPTNPPGYSGATHFTNTLDLQVLDNQVHDNYGRGIWFDIDSRGALVRGNVVERELNYSYANTPYAVGDGIRIEISCDVTVEGNTVSANQGPGIAVDGSDEDLVSGNVVLAPAGQPGIRVAPQDQRTSQPAGTNCDGTLRTARNNTVTGNTVTLQGHTPASDYDGVLQKKVTSDTTGTVFDANTYHVSSCAAHLWYWWTGSTQAKVAFATLQSLYGQESHGSCPVPGSAGRSRFSPRWGG